jgi:hypothetical protein
MGILNQVEALVFVRGSHESVGVSGWLLQRLLRRVNGFSVNIRIQNITPIIILRVRYHRLIHLIAALLPQLRQLLNLLAAELAFERGMYGLSWKNNIPSQYLHNGISTMLGL